MSRPRGATRTQRMILAAGDDTELLELAQLLGGIRAEHLAGVDVSRLREQRERGRLLGKLRALADLSPFDGEREAARLAIERLRATE